MPNNDAKRAAAYERPYLDSSAYIAAIVGEAGRANEVRQILQRAEDGELRIIATTVVLAEVHRPGTADWTTDRIDRYFRRPQFSWVEVDYPLGTHARGLARDHRLRGADAIHLAGALRGGADVLFTYDRRLLRVTDVGISVTEPYFKGQMSLPETDDESEDDHASGGD